MRSLWKSIAFSGAAIFLFLFIGAGQSYGASLDPDIVKSTRNQIAEADRLFGQDKIEEALGIYREVEYIYDLLEFSPPVLLYNSLAQCYDKLEQVGGALSYYQKFMLRSNELGRKHAKIVAEARGARDRLQELVESTAIRFEVEPDGTEVRVNKRFVGKTPIDPVTVNPGMVQVTLWAEGHEPMAKVIHAEAGEIAAVQATLVVKESDEEIAEGPLAAKSGEKWGAVASGTLSLLSGTGAVISLMSGLKYDKQAEKYLQRVYPSLDEATAASLQMQSLYNKAAGRKNLAWGLSALSLVAAGGAGYLYFSSGRSDSGQSRQGLAASPPKQGLLPVIGFVPFPGGGGLSMFMIF